MKEPKKKKPLFTSLMLVLAAVLIAGDFMLLRRAWQTQASNEVLALTQQAVTVLATPDPGTGVHTLLASDIPPELEKPPISVDFAYLQDINPDVKAWLYCEDTVINFAVMQSKDNDYYLHHLADGSSGIYGSVFADYRCTGQFTDLNTILYGHDMQNGSIFGGLELYRDQGYYESHPVMYLLTPERNYRLDAVCGYLHTVDTPLYELPASPEGLENALWTGISRSSFSSGITPREGDRFVTLSTCADDYSGAKYAMIFRMTAIG